MSEFRASDYIDFKDFLNKTGMKPEEGLLFLENELKKER